MPSITTSYPTYTPLICVANAAASRNMPAVALTFVAHHAFVAETSCDSVCEIASRFCSITSATLFRRFLRLEGPYEAHSRCPYYESILHQSHEILTENISKGEGIPPFVPGLLMQLPYRCHRYPKLLHSKAALPSVHIVCKPSPRRHIFIARRNQFMPCVYYYTRREAHQGILYSIRLATDGGRVLASYEIRD